MATLIAGLLGLTDVTSSASTLSVRAENDSNNGNTPTEIEVFADGVSQGVLVFGNLDDSFTVESLTISSGFSTLRLLSLNDYYDPSLPFSDGRDLNAYIDWIEVDGNRIEAEAYDATGNTRTGATGVDSIIANYRGTGDTIINLWHADDWVEFEFDTTPPEVSCSVAGSSLWPPNHSMVDVGFSYSVADNEDANPTVEVLIFSDEPVDAPGSGNTGPDATDDGEVLSLRAERSGNGDGRVYLIVVAATDSAGNIGYGCCTVTVAKNQGNKHQASVAAQALLAESECVLDGTIPAGFHALLD